MNILLVPAGTRGDVQPLVALGRELKRRSHSVLVSSPEDSEQFVTSNGLACATGTPSYRDFMNSIKHRPFLEVLAGQIDYQFENLIEQGTGADAIVGCMLPLAAPSVAEWLRIPYFTTVLGPSFLRSEHHPPVSAPWLHRSANWNRKQWDDRDRDWNRALLQPINTWRSRLGLYSIKNANDYVFQSGHLLCAWEPVLATVPADACSVCEPMGAFFLESGRLDPEIARFCDGGGSRPVFIGFGSLAASNPEALLWTIVEAVRQAGARAVIAAGWSEMRCSNVPDYCKLIGSAPFDKLFPKVAAVIHHGGAGTTAMAAQCGVPQAIIAHWSDHYFWQRRVNDLGLGPLGFPIRKLTVGALARLIVRLLTKRSGYASRAIEIGVQIDPAQGVRNAAEAIARRGSGFQHGCCPLQQSTPHCS